MSSRSVRAPGFIWSLLPVALLVAIATAVLVSSDVPPVAILAFAGYMAIFVVLPGLLWVRLLRGRSSHLAEDAALGFATGCAIQVGAYVVARAVGLPQLHIAWAIATLAVFAAHPGLRQHFRGSGERAPAAWIWATCLLLSVVLVHAAALFATHQLSGSGTPYVDMPYHLALIGELKHHVPPEVPYVAGEPLAYHWFWYAQAAAVSWTTGIEPVTLLYRLDILPMVGGFVLLTAFAARRVTGAWWPAPIAAALALFVSLPSPWSWGRIGLPGGPPVLDAQPLAVAWVSPTHAFGLLLTGAVLLVLLDRLDNSSRTRPRVWLLVVILVFGAAGAKASTLPVILAGLVATLGVSLIRTREVDRDAAIGAGIVAAGLAFAVAVLFRGATGGLIPGLESLRHMNLALAVGVTRARGMASVGIPVLILGISGIMWAMQGAAAASLVVGSRSIRDDRRLWLLLGMIAAAIAAASFLDYAGLSQGYYLKGTAAVPGILIAWGAYRLLGPSPSRGTVLATAIALLLGAAIVLVIRALGAEVPPQVGRDGFLTVAMALIVPVIALVGALTVATLGLRALLGRRLEVSMRVLAVALVTGAVLPSAAMLATGPLVPAAASQVLVPADGIAAARWLRDHSSPDDLVATNMHCRQSPSSTPCDARHFWVSGYAERRVLVEGWAYTTRANAGYAAGDNVILAPFWDQERLSINDEAFTSPATGVPALRTAYPVRWLFADLETADEPGLGLSATERFRAGAFAVYEVAPG